MAEKRIYAWYVHHAIHLVFAMVLFVAIVSSIKEAPPEWPLILVFAVAVLLFWGTFGRTWRVSASTDGLVARRLWRTRRIAWSEVTAVDTPLWGFNPTFRPRRIKLKDGSSLTFISTYGRMDIFEQLRRKALGTTAAASNSVP